MSRHESRHRHERSRWFGRGRTRALLSVGLLLGAGAVATSAYWHDEATVDGASVQAGAIHIDLATNNKVKPETYVWSDLSGSIPATGGSVAKVLRVRNNSNGRLTFGYTVSATASGSLGAALKVTVLKGGSVSSSTCTGGTAVGTAGVSLNGFSASGGNLAATAATPYHDLCVQVTLPPSSGVGQLQSSNVVLTFNATQVIA
ncbi:MULTISPECIES: SipW-dependent-type signal peptide-containing protein [unclassified Nocardioides]|uniref:SipW-dependent-type signal peptide-containing protein n=1 Tax=unclassified Nocardioides TaxID=2615069 RepID=UPI000703BCAD|nr:MULTISPECIES: SipW-dependent-type signal peptide-containing protein [unclassified Nocardioides]KRC48992.1 hypothetical protein ASE19_19045 [Nocardioides sp. Root79]KRC75393.1 hypothetical protein ASE20_20950 [Nocardioides sp. Root240]